MTFPKPRESQSEVADPERARVPPLRRLDGRFRYPKNRKVGAGIATDERSVDPAAAGEQHAYALLPPDGVRRGHHHAAGPHDSAGGDATARVHAHHRLADSLGDIGHLIRYRLKGVQACLGRCHSRTPLSSPGSLKRRPMGPSIPPL